MARRGHQSPPVTAPVPRYCADSPCLLSAAMRRAIRLPTRLGAPVVETSAGVRQGAMYGCWTSQAKSPAGHGPALFLAAALTGRPSSRRSVKTDRNERFSSPAQAVDTRGVSTLIAFRRREGGQAARATTSMTQAITSPRTAGGSWSSTSARGAAHQPYRSHDGNSSVTSSHPVPPLRLSGRRPNTTPGTVAETLVAGPVPSFVASPPSSPVASSVAI